MLRISEIIAAELLKQACGIGPGQSSCDERRGSLAPPPKCSEKAEFETGRSIPDAPKENRDADK